MEPQCLRFNRYHGSNRSQKIQVRKAMDVIFTFDYDIIHLSPTMVTEAI